MDRTYWSIKRNLIPAALMAFGLTACGGNVSNNSSKPIITGSTTTSSFISKGSKRPTSLFQSKLTGVNTQFAFSTIVGSMWTSQKIEMSAIAPASTGTSNGEVTLSLPISGGTFGFQKSGTVTNGVIENSGGFKLTQNGKVLLSITRIVLNLKKQLVQASVNGQSDFLLFNIDGKAAISTRGSQTTAYGLTIQLPNTTNKLLNTGFIPDRSLGALTLTTTTKT